MIAERWGSLAVADHTSTSDLIANVLLYDRLIVPVMSEQADRNERAYWLSKKWDPDLQKERVAQLGRLAIPRPWDASRREAFKTRMQQLKMEQLDTKSVELLAQQMTRGILAMEPVTEKNPDVERVDVIAAYNSASAAQKDFVIEQAAKPIDAHALLLARRLAIPSSKKPEKSLERAIELSRNPEFRKKRTALFDFQEEAILKKWSPAETVKRIAAMNDELNEQIRDSAKTVRWKLAFAVCGIGLGLATGVTAIALGTAALQAVQFFAFDRKPAIDGDSTKPAAMFHDMKTTLGIHLEA